MALQLAQGSPSPHLDRLLRKPVVSGVAPPPAARATDRVQGRSRPCPAILPGSTHPGVTPFEMQTFFHPTHPPRLAVLERSAVAVGLVLVLVVGLTTRQADGQCEPPTGLACAVACNPIRVDLTWDADPTAADVSIFRDGFLVATVGASASIWSDDDPPSPVATYELLRSCPGGPGAATSCRVLTTPAWPRHLIWDAELSAGAVASASVLEAVLAGLPTPESFSTTTDILSTTGSSPCAGLPGSGTTIWVFLGTFPDNHPLSDEEGALLVRALRNGASIVMSGADAFAFDPPTAFASWDGVADGALDGDDSFTSMVGADHPPLLLLLMDATYEQDQLGDDSTDWIAPATSDFAGSDAGAVWSHDLFLPPGAYDTGVHYATDFNRGDVIAQSWELGGYGGDLPTLVERYRDALRPGCPGPQYLHCVRNCTPGVETVELLWINGGPYSSIVICRDGVEQAVLPGCSQSWVDASPPAGAATYRVLGICSGAPTCDQDQVPPSQGGYLECGVGTANPISLTCIPNGSGVTLSWTSAVTYTRYVVLVGGACWAILPGDASALDIPVLPGGGPTVCIFGEGDAPASDSATSFTADCRACCDMIPSPSVTFVRGDVNADGQFDVGDALYLLHSLFTLGAPMPSCADSADASDDGDIDISDAIYILFSLFIPGSPLPPEPMPTCGPDPTDDDLECADFGPCP